MPFIIIKDGLTLLINMVVLKRIVFFAQDEGSAKALAPVIRSMRARAKTDLDVVAGKIAVQAFRQCGITCREAESLVPETALLPRPDLVVTGASMRASIEKEAIGLARKAGIPSMTLLDSPTWFWWRFTVDGERDLTALPDRILVPNPACRERMIFEQFPAECLQPTGNPHYDTLRTRAESSRQSSPQTVLVVTQPQYKDGIYQSDLSWLNTVVTVCRRLDPDLALTVRPHSKEDPHRFDSILSPHCQVDADSCVLDLIESHRLIIGKNSSALLEAALLGRRVISFSPEVSDLLTSPIVGWGMFRQAKNNDELEGLIRAGVKHRADCTLARDIPFYTDGCNSERVIDAIMIMLHTSKERMDV